MGTRNAQDTEQALRSVVPAQETIYRLTEKLIMSVASLENQMVTMQTNVALSTPIERKRKSLAESKCIGYMKTLCSDKAEFRMWNERFTNAIAQVLGVPWRMYMRNLNRKLDQSRTVLTQDELNHIEGIQEINEIGN